MTLKQESPAGDGRAFGCHAPRLDNPKFTRSNRDPQAATRAIAAGLACLARPSDVAFILRRRLDLQQRGWLATSLLISLPPDAAEDLAEDVLHHLHAGPPPVTFWSLRDEARDWAFFASRGERCHYLAAAWGQLSPDDRQRFLRRAI